MPSCICNTKTIMNEEEVVDVRAVMPIKRGCEITKSYVSSFYTTQVRQEKLEKGWYFRSVPQIYQFLSLNTRN